MNESFRETIHTPVQELSPNYKGDWTLLFQKRMHDPVIRAQIATVCSMLELDIKESIHEMENFLKDPETSEEEKAQFKKYIDRSYKELEILEKDIQNHDLRLDEVFSSTEIVFPKEVDFKIAQGVFDTPGKIVVGPVTYKGHMLDSRMKNIVESHEKGHGMRLFDPSYATHRKIQMVLDKEKIDASSADYLDSPEEIIERMSQLKNYFGFDGHQKFTREHLEYARKHYIADTGFDNVMSEFFEAITPEREEVFLEVINSYGV